MDIVSLRKGDLGNFQRQLRVISKRKEDLLREQAEVAKVLNATYTDWVDDSKTVCKSLETCVVLSRRPGTLPYVYGKKQNVEDTEKLIERIRNIQEQISAADAERAALEAKKRNEYATVQPVSSFDEWFAKNGRPQHLHEPQYGWASNFVPSKTYVNHYGIDDMTGTFSKEKFATSNPRSKSITMMRGRLAGK